jgi:COPII coat assembly protein SEC16
LFSFNLKNRLVKLFNPDATLVDDLGEKMQAYYDTDKKVWVFPGQDPAEVARPVAPPPTAPLPSAPTPEAPASLDPLAAMMAPPPRRGPARPSQGAAVLRRSPASMPMMFPPGMMPTNGTTSTAGSAPKISVFSPRPEDQVGKKENE